MADIYDPSIAADTLGALADFRSPGVANEFRVVNSGTVSIFQLSMSVGKVHYVQSDGATIYFTLNGASPSMSEGTGSNLGIPVANGAREYFIPRTDFNVMKCRNDTSGSAAKVMLGIASISGTIVP